jgi:hypothetical protein
MVIPRFRQYTPFNVNTYDRPRDRWPDATAAPFPGQPTTVPTRPKNVDFALTQNQRLTRRFPGL